MVTGMRRILLPVLTALLALTASPADAREELLELSPPVPGSVLRGFQVGPSPWSAGHRGVDLSAAPGDEVRAAADGVVHFTGSVAGIRSVSIDHGGVRTTYTPVRAKVSQGDVVATGQVIGHLTTGHCAVGCLHLGLTDGQDYFDPLAHMASRPVALVTAGATPSPHSPISLHPVGELPVEGRITSRFGMRVHPVTGKYKLHDGVDIAASCGTAVRLPWAGTVELVERHPAYGNRVVVNHGSRRSAYAHLLGLGVRVGDELRAGDTVGRVGSTGLSTGCHLHWMLWIGGELVDPLAP